MLEPIVYKFRPDLSVRLKDIAEKQVPAKLRLIVVDLLTAGNGYADVWWHDSHSGMT